MRVWVAALIAVLVLIGAGLGGFFIGRASANGHDRAGGRAGVGRMHHGQMPGGPGWLQGPRGYYYGPVPGPAPKQRKQQPSTSKPAPSTSSSSPAPSTTTTTP